VLSDRKVKGLVIGTEGEVLPAGYKAKLDHLLEGNRLVDASRSWSSAALVKTPEEIPAPAPATEITSRAHASSATLSRSAYDHDLFKADGPDDQRRGDGIRFITSVRADKLFRGPRALPDGNGMKRGDFVKGRHGRGPARLQRRFCPLLFHWQDKSATPGDMEAAQ